MRSALAALVIAGTVASVHADVGVYGIGVNAEVGNTYLPPTASLGTMTMLSYREHGGKLGNWLMVIASAPAQPTARSSTRLEDCCTGDGNTKSCSTWEVTTTTTPSDAEVAQWQQDMEEFSTNVAPAILRGELGQELQLDIVMRSLGGDASGFNFRLYRPLGGGLWIGQFAFTYLEFPGVETQHVVAENGTLRTMTKVADYEYKYVGMPIRLALPIGETGFGITGQFDLNVLSLFFDEPSPLRAGIRWAGYHVILGVEGVVSGLAPDGASLRAEALVAF